MRQWLVILNMIKVEHTVFALPFAFLGAFLGARGFPGWRTTFWILVAMLAARSTAMAFNRLADRVYDALNPRTANRALPLGLISKRFVVFFICCSATLFAFSTWMLNPLAFYLFPFALTLVLLYSYTKRFTSLSHLILGLCLACAPIGGWVAVRAELDLAVFYVGAAVLLWVAGFDIIYACQDVDFDRKVSLHSLPSKLGIRVSLAISVFCHVLMVFLLSYAFILFELSLLSWTGLLLLVIGLIYEHHLVSPDDLSQVNAAFFTVNGVISLVVFLFVGVDLYLFG